MSRPALIILLLGLARLANGAEPEHDDDDREDIVPIERVPLPVQQAVIHERMDHAERIFHEMERCDGRFKAEFTGPDGDGFIELESNGTIVLRTGSCQLWPSIRLDAIPPAARTALTRLIGTTPIQHLEYQVPTNLIDHRLQEESTRYRAVFVDNGVCTVVTVTATGELVQLHTSRKD